MLKGFSLEERSWMMYDWANSVYSSVVTAAVLPIYFTSLTAAAGISGAMSSVYWGYAVAAASLIVALFAPLLGALGDYKGMKMRLLRVFLAIGVVSTAALAFFSGWQVILAVSIVTGVGFAGATIFYDASLVDVTTPERMDKVSSYGFALGYIGGSTIPFIGSIALIMFGEQIGIPRIVATRLSFVITAVWWAFFSIPMLTHVKQKHYLEHEQGLLAASFRRVSTTLRNVQQYRRVFLFLVSYFFYIDGVGTIIRMATIYGASVGISTQTMMAALVVIQIVAFPCAIIFGRLAEKYGSAIMLFVGMGIYIVISVLGFRMTTAAEFWGLALLVATAQGGIQAISRSHFGKMIPKHKFNEFFGMYDIFSRFGTILGPMMFAMLTQATGNPRFGVLSVIAQFTIGAVFLWLSERVAKTAIPAGTVAA